MPVCNRLRVLLLDDHQGLAQELGPAIRALGYEVFATDRVAALATALFSSADVVVLSLDLGAADAVNLGRKLSEQARWRKPLVVGLAGAEDANAPHRAGVIGTHLVLMKPINVAVLAGVIRRFRELLAGEETRDPGV